MKHLENIKIACIVTDGFEQEELTKPKQALEQEGAVVDIIAPNQGKVRGWKSKNWGDEFSINLDTSTAKAEDYQALLLPGGVINPDSLRIIPAVIEFIKKIAHANKPIAAICHGPWTLINAELVRGKKVTSWPSLKIDLINAGAHWVDQEVVVDGMLITSRNPGDIPAFNAALIDLLSK